MSLWPYARKTDFVSGSAPAVGADNYLNPSQDQIVRLTKATSGGGFLLNDEFAGNAIDRGKWAVVTAAPTLVDDSAAFGSGALKAGNTDSIYTQKLYPHTADFHIMAKVRTTVVSGVANTVLFGFTGAGTDNLYVSSTGSGANWFLYRNAVGTDLGIAAGATYQLIEIDRTSSVLKVFINGAEVYSAANTTDLLAPIFQLQVGALAGGFGWFDDVALWFDR